MKYLLTLIMIISLLCGCQSGQDLSPGDAGKQDGADGQYDPLLAEKLGADDYGMCQYVFAFLKAGPNRDQDSLTAANLQKAHLANITRLAEAGKLVLAGPFMDDGDIRGIYIFAVQSVAEARQLTATDPAIQAGRLTMELHPWYGSAGLKQLGELHKRLAKKQF